MTLEVGRVRSAMGVGDGVLERVLRDDLGGKTPWSAA